MKSLFLRFMFEETGQDLIEYGLLAAFIALVCIAAINALGGQINATYQSFSTQIGNAAAAS